MYAYVYMYVYAYMYAYVYMYAYMYVYAYVYMYAYVYNNLYNMNGFDATASFQLCQLFVKKEKRKTKKETTSKCLCTVQVKG